jgi:RND superfamily putative drug exporter
VSVAPLDRVPGPKALSASSGGWVERLGGWAATHVRVVVAGWAVIAVVLGVFAPRVEHALSGAGWEASGSESVAARALVQEHFGGLSSEALTVVVHSDGLTFDDPAFQSALGRVERILSASPDIASVVSAERGSSVSADGHTALVLAGARGTPAEAVAAADLLQGSLEAAAAGGVEVVATGASAMWADFNEANRSAMMTSELVSWPVTLAILVVAFGSLVAAGLPLLLTIVGLVASAGLLGLLAFAFDISIWAMNFALMFALALGIDYALFVVHRFRGALFASGLDARDAVRATMDTAGKAVLFSGATVLVSLTAVMLVPSPAFRSMALGIMISVVFVLAATLTLLPAVLAKLGSRVDRLAVRWVHSGEHRSPAFSRWAERIWRHPYRYGLAAVGVLVALSLPVLGLKTGMPSIAVVPADDQSRAGYAVVQEAFGSGAPGTLQIVTSAEAADQAGAVAAEDPGIARVLPVQSSGALALVQAVPTDDPSSPAVGETIDRLRSGLPPGALVGGAVAENHDLEDALASRTPLVMALVLALGFVLLLVALRAPVVAALGVLTNLLAVSAAFGVGRLVFQDGIAAGLLGFESQGYLDAWAPVFFFAMVFAISMDYTVFLLASAKEHFDRSGHAREAMVGGLAHSGRVIFAAAAVMVAVFFTFAISGPLPPKEMGVILGVAVLLDAFLIRLVLMPALLEVAGRRAWALPRWLDRVLPDVTFGHR